MNGTYDSGFVGRLADSLSRSDVLEVVLKSTVVSALIKARAERDMNQKQFAGFMGVSQAMVSKWESGDCNFTVETIARICEKLGLIPDLKLTSENDYLAMRRKSVLVWASESHAARCGANDWISAA